MCESIFVYLMADTINGVMVTNKECCEDLLAPAFFLDCLSDLESGESIFCHIDTTSKTFNEIKEKYKIRG